MERQGAGGSDRVAPDRITPVRVAAVVVVAHPCAGLLVGRVSVLVGSLYRPLLARPARPGLRLASAVAGVLAAQATRNVAARGDSVCGPQPHVRGSARARAVRAHAGARSALCDL